MTRIISLLVALAVVLAMAGCSGKPDASDVPAGMKVTNLTPAQLAAGQQAAMQRRAQRQVNQ